MSTLSVYHVRVALLLVAAQVAHPMARSDEPSTAKPAVVPVQTVSSAKSPEAEVPELIQDKPQATESFALPIEHHAWARFPVGAWREIQITTETFDESGVAVSSSATSQAEKLESVFGNRYELKVQATVDLVGKRITGKAITRVLATTTDGAGQIVETRRLEDTELALTGQKVVCQAWDIVYRDDARTMVDRLLYSPQRYPHVLSRTTAEVASTDGDPPTTEQEVSVVAVEIPYVHDGEILLCTCLRTTRQGKKGSTVRISLVCDLVPGGEVAVWATDFDPQGKRTRWSTQKLAGYGRTPPPEVPASRRDLRRSRRRGE